MNGLRTPDAVAWFECKVLTSVSKEDTLMLPAKDGCGFELADLRCGKYGVA